MQFWPKRFRTDSCHAVGDAAYHGKALLVARTTITTRLPANAALYALRRHAPASGADPGSRAHRLGTPPTWPPPRSGAAPRSPGTAAAMTVEIADIPSIWYGAFGNTPGRTVLVRDPGGDKRAGGLHHRHRQCTETVVARYAHRWPIETAIAGGKQLLGIGQARNRLQRAVERTVPLSFCVYSLVIVWYTLHGYHPDDLTGRRADQPWYPHKDDIAFEDMLAKLRRSLVAARITALTQLSPIPVNTATTNWPAPQPPHNCEIREMRVAVNEVFGADDGS